MKTLTVRKVPKRVADALDRERRRRGRSLNQTVLDLLGDGLGVGASGRRSNGLAQLAGTWSAGEHAQFESAVESARQVDDEIWR